MARRRARQKAKPYLAAVHSELPPPERAQHGPVHMDFVPKGMEDTTRKSGAFAEPVDDPLYRKHRQKTLSRKQYEAGIQLRLIAEKAIARPGIIGSYGERTTGGGCSDSMMVKNEDQYRRYVHAIRAAGPQYSRVVVSVVLMQDDIPRASVPLLKGGLDRLALHFRL